jgi:LysM repeat protein
MLTRMKSRLAVVGLSALSLLGVTACGSSSGTGASPVTTIKIGTPSYQTLAPVITSAPAPSTVPGAGSGGAPTGTEQTYKVVGGDILSRIAKRYCVTPQAIADYNQWAGGTAHKYFPGDVWKIPPTACAPGSVPATQVTTAPGPDATTAVTTPQETTTTFDASTGGTYTVQKGDTLTGIAKKTGTTVDGIVAANGWEGPGHVYYPGQKIKLPAKTG